MTALLPLDTFSIELRAIAFGYLSRVGEKYVVTFGFAEDSGSDTALTDSASPTHDHIIAIRAQRGFDKKKTSTFSREKSILTTEIAI